MPNADISSIYILYINNELLYNRRKWEISDNRIILDDNVDMQL